MENSRLIMQRQYKKPRRDSHARHLEDEEPAGDSQAGRADSTTSGEHKRLNAGRPFPFTHLFGQRISGAVSWSQSHWLSVAADTTAVSQLP